MAGRLVRKESIRKEMTMKQGQIFMTLDVAGYETAMEGEDMRAIVMTLDQGQTVPWHYHWTITGGFRREVQPRRQHWFLNEKVGFPRPHPRLLLGFQGTKSARREGISSPFNNAGGCTSPQNSGTDSFVCLKGPMVVGTRAPRNTYVLNAGERCAVPPKTAHHVHGLDDGQCQFMVLQGIGVYDNMRVGIAGD
jgi:quercetin dioxygenase-like cupin family protein